MEEYRCYTIINGEVTNKSVVSTISDEVMPIRGIGSLIGVYVILESGNFVGAYVSKSDMMMVGYGDLDGCDAVFVRGDLFKLKFNDIYKIIF